MRDLLEASGAIFGSLGDREVPRHFGEPAVEYEAAVERLAVADRSHRVRLEIGGRSPGQMLQGIVTGRMPDEPLPTDDPYAVRAEYSAVLTPKGKLVTDLRLLRLSGEEAYLLDVPVAGASALVAYLGKFLPPRLASTDDVSDETGMLTVVGPEGADLLVREAMGLRADPEQLESLEEGDGLRLDDGGALGINVIRTSEIDAPAFDVLADRSTIRTLWTRIIEAGARPIGLGVWETLRVEAGRPAFGFDMDEDTLPHEAGIVDRAVDQSKGCYTGQEVIVRIRDRGRVNRELRGITLGEGPAPTRGAELFRADSGKSVGRVRTVVDSPRSEGAIALAYVRREVEVSGVLRVGSPDGPEATVSELSPGWSRPSRSAT